MKALVATQKPFAAKAVEGIKAIFKAAGIETVMLEKYVSEAELIESVADVDALIVRSDKVTKAVYGYDQRVEAFGSKGMASDANDLLNTTTVLTKDGAHSEKPLWFFLERYNQAFINQVISFVDAINNDTETAVGAIDGLRPVLMAKAATESCRNGGVYVKVEE